jgi:transposase
MEACAGAHYWAREIAKLGHHVRLIAPAYVKPFIKRQKNDAADAEAICEAAQRPSMRFVPVKTEEQQANGIVFRARDLLVRQRTQCVNALRGHLLEYGYVFPKGITHVETLVALVENLQSSLPDSVRVILKLLVDTFTALEAQIAGLDAEINQRSRSDPTARRLMTIPSVGPITSTAITALVPAAEGFPAGRDFAAWLGLTPLQKSTGGKQKLGAVSKRGERTIPSANHRSECRGSTGQPARGTQGLVACADVGSQAENAGHRGSRQQNGPYHLGSAGQRRCTELR